MTAEETTLLLGFIEGLDKRITLNERAVSAWKNVLPTEISLRDAMRYVREHYRETDRAVLPANIVGRYRMDHAPEPRRAVGSSDHECMSGFVLVNEVSAMGLPYEAVIPCPLCSKIKLRSLN